MEGPMLHELFMTQAAATPDAVAARLESRTLSYEHLDDWSNAVAHHILERVGGDRFHSPPIVAIAMERSLALVAGLLGIMKAGCAYLPLDLSYPSARLQYCIKDANAVAILTGKDEDSEVILRGIESDEFRADVSKRMFLVPPLCGERLTAPRLSSIPSTAYVIYTSGSTGQPKGVLCTHKGIANRIHWMQFEYQLSSADKVLQKTPFGFDVSVWEFFWPLTVGAEIVLALPGGHRDPQYLASLIKSQRVTVCHFVPSMLGPFLGEPLLSECCMSLRHVFCSGEALPRELSYAFYRTLPSASLHNLYGPTEASVDVTFYRCPKEEDDVYQTATAPIGVAVANTEVYIMERESLQLCPVGQVGSLFISGVQLAEGYLNKPDLTREKFVANPLARGRDAFSRMYDTGDLARYLRGGVVEFMGRQDAQVKIHGMRIELGEIESTIAKHEAVSHAAVITRQDTPGQVKIVAYVVCRRDKAFDEKQCRSDLEERLPSHMIPSHIVVLESLPVTANGKLDRKALPAPVATRHGHRYEFEEPHEGLEQELSKVLSAVLMLPKTSRKDDLYSIGLDSILAIRVVGRARSVLPSAHQFSVTDLLKSRTIEQLARCIESRESPQAAAGNTQDRVMISVADNRLIKSLDGIQDAFPLSNLQAGMVYWSLQQPKSYLYQVVMSLQVALKFDESRFKACLDTLVANHPILRTFYDLSSFSEPIQLVRDKCQMPLEVIDISQLDRENQTSVLTEWLESGAEYQFDFAVAPLAQCVIHVRGENSFQFGMMFHDSILDGWSRAMLLSELFESFVGTTDRSNASSSVDLPKPPTYRDYVVVESDAKRDPAHHKFWVQKLMNCGFQGLGPTLQSLSRPETTFHVQRNLDVIATIDESTVSKLRESAAQMRVGLKSLLLAAHCHAIGFLCGTSDVVTGIVANGRLEVDGGERVLGNHLNTVPFRIDVSTDKCDRWSDLISSVFEEEMDLLPFRRFPVAQIVKDLRNAGALGFAEEPFDTAFNFTDFHVMRSREWDRKSTNIFKRVDFTDPFHYVLVAIFRVDEVDNRLDLVLNYDSTKVPSSLLNEIVDIYSDTIKVIAYSPNGRREGLKFDDPPKLNRKCAAHGDPMSGKQPESKTEKLLASVWRDVLGSAVDGVDEDFFESGGDSILSLTFCARVRKRGLPLSPAVVPKMRTIAKMAAWIEEFSGLQGERGTSSAVDQTVKMMPSQLWCTSLINPNPSYWNMEFLLAVPPEVDLALLETSVNDTLKYFRSDMGVVFDLNSNQAVFPSPQSNGAHDKVKVYPEAFDWHDLSRVSQISYGMHSSLDVVSGPCFKGALLQSRDQDRPHILLFALHHLIFDAYSSQIFCKQVVHHYLSLARGTPSPLSLPTNSFQSWVHHVAKLKCTLAEAKHWENIFSQLSVGSVGIPLDHVDGKNIERSNRILTRELSKGETRLFERTSNSRGYTPEVLFCSALALTILKWRRECDSHASIELAFDVVSHGRDQHDGTYDLSESVGFFANSRVALAVFPNERLQTVIDAMEQALSNKVPQVTCGVYLRDNPDAVQIRRAVEVNYIGNFDTKLGVGGFQFMTHEDERTRCPEATRPYQLEVKGLIVNQKLRLEWHYSHNLHSEETSNRLAEEFMVSLRHVVQALTSRQCEAQPESLSARSRLFRIENPIGPSFE